MSAMARVRIPSSFRKLTGGREVVEVGGATVGELLAGLEQAYPGIKQHLCDDQGKVLRFVNIFANEEDIRFLANLETPLRDTDEVSIIPAIAGG
jgi:molybdopterin synthase sulfur carrier subunit